MSADPNAALPPRPPFAAGLCLRDNNRGPHYAGARDARWNATRTPERATRKRGPSTERAYGTAATHIPST